MRGRPFTPFWDEKSVLRQFTVMKIWRGEGRGGHKLKLRKRGCLMSYTLKT